MAKNNKKGYAIYGDDDQSKFSELIKLEDRIQEMVDILNAETMRERKKAGKKNTKLKNTSKNAIKVEGISDVTTGVPEGTALDVSKLSAKEDKKNKNKAKKERKPKEPGEKKSPLGLIIILVLLLIIAAIGWMFKDDIKAGAMSIYNTIQQKMSGGQQNEVVDPNASVTPVDDSSEKLPGYIETNSRDTYSLTEALVEVGNMQVALQEHYNTLKTIATDSLTKNIDVDLDEERRKVNSDYENFLTYSGILDDFEGGPQYFASLKSRFDNLNELMHTVGEVKSSEVYNYINKYIRTENDYMYQSKDLLIQLLDRYEINYTEQDNRIIFDVN